MSEDNGTLRTFDTGATRDTGKDKLEPHGFLSPEALHRFSQYMHKHRKQSDGSLRAPDNWKKGIPQEEYFKSFLRHAMDFWAVVGGGVPLYDPNETDPEEIACAIMFNIQGWLHENVKAPKVTMYNTLQECGYCRKKFEPGTMALYREGRYYCDEECKRKDEVPF